MVFPTELIHISQLSRCIAVKISPKTGKLNVKISVKPNGQGKVYFGYGMARKSTVE